MVWGGGIQTPDTLLRKYIVAFFLNGEVEKDGTTLSVSRPILPDVSVSADGRRGFVRFTLDESDPLRGV